MTSGSVEKCHLSWILKNRYDLAMRTCKNQKEKHKQNKEGSKHEE